MKKIYYLVLMIFMIVASQPVFAKANIHTKTNKNNVSKQKASLKKKSARKTHESYSHKVAKAKIKNKSNLRPKLARGVKNKKIKTVAKSNVHSKKSKKLNRQATQHDSWQ